MISLAGIVKNIHEEGGFEMRRWTSNSLYEKIRSKTTKQPNGSIGWTYCRD